MIPKQKLMIPKQNVMISYDTMMISLWIHMMLGCLYDFGIVLTSFGMVLGRCWYHVDMVLASFGMVLDGWMDGYAAWRKRPQSCGPVSLVVNLVMKKHAAKIIYICTSVPVLKPSALRCPPNRNVISNLRPFYLFARKGLPVKPTMAEMLFQWRLPSPDV